MQTALHPTMSMMNQGMLLIVSFCNNNNNNNNNNTARYQIKSSKSPTCLSHTHTQIYAPIKTDKLFLILHNKLSDSACHEPL